MANAFSLHDGVRRLTTTTSHLALTGSASRDDGVANTEAGTGLLEPSDAHQPNPAETVLRLRHACFSTSSVPVLSRRVAEVYQETTFPADRASSPRTASVSAYHVAMQLTGSLGPPRARARTWGKDHRFHRQGVG